MSNRKKSANRYHQMKKYGIQPFHYELMLKHQDNKCAICKNPPVNNQLLVVDHNHDTGEVRGLLCNNCNLALGHLKDSSEIANQASIYLEEGGHSSRFYAPSVSEKVEL